MTQYNKLNVKLSNSQLYKLKSAIKNGTKVTLNFSSNVVGDSKDENSFPHRLLLTYAKVFKLRKAFANNSSANIKLSKTQLHKIGPSGGLIRCLLGPLLKTGLPLIGNVAKSVLIPLGLTAAASATDAAIHKKMFESGFTIQVISNEERNDIMNIVKSLKDSGLLIKGVRKQLKMKQKSKREDFSK